MAWRMAWHGMARRGQGGTAQHPRTPTWYVSVLCRVVSCAASCVQAAAQQLASNVANGIEGLFGAASRAASGLVSRARVTC